ncbi:hypothetical protein Tco_0040669 [Tanacetum coccineum]
MGTKVTSSSGSVLKEPEIQKLQMQAKIFKEKTLEQLMHLNQPLNSRHTEYILIQQAFSRLFGDSFRTFEFQLCQHMNNLETLLNAETLHEMDSKSSALIVDQNAAECVDERAALANLIANLTHDTEENKTIQKQLKKANASLTQELKECKTNLDETSRALGEATSSRDSSLIALQTKQTELEKYTALNDLTSDYKILQTKLNETLGLLARKDIDIQEGLKTKTYEISVVNQKHDELVKKSLLTRSQFEGQLKEKRYIRYFEQLTFSKWKSSLYTPTLKSDARDI